MLRLLLYVLELSSHTFERDDRRDGLGPALLDDVALQLRLGGLQLGALRRLDQPRVRQRLRSGQTVSGSANGPV